jgi:hemoglobin/transferrin/lactoferrin receptor protein
MRFLLLLTFPVGLSAQMVFEETVVTASRLEEEATESPNVTAVVTNGDFLDNSFRSLPEALALTPGVSVQKTTHGHGSPFIRGFTGRQNLYLIDGIRLNNSTFRAGPVQYANTIDAFALDRFELVKSQGSVLYGSDALGGTLNSLTTSSGYLERDPGFFQTGSASYRYDTNSQSHLGRLQQTIGSGGMWGLTFGTTLKDFGNIESNFFGEMENTGYPEQNYDLKLEFSPTDNLHLTLFSQYLNQDDVWRWHSTTLNPGGWEGLAPGEFDSRIYDQERWLSYFKLKHEPFAHWIDHYTLTLSYQTTQDSEFQDRRNPDPLVSRNQIRFGDIVTDTFGVSFEAQSSLGNTSLLYGVDYYEDHVDSEGFRINTATGVRDDNRAPIADDSIYRSLGVFAQARTTWSDSLETTAGLRYTYAEADIGSLDAEDSWEALVFNLRALYRWNDTWTTFGGYSQGFRAPNLNDLTGSVTSRSGLDSLGTLGLDPELTQTFEIGTRARSDTFSFEAAAFYTLIDDLIVRIEDGGGTERSRNAAEAWITGIEAEGRYALSDCWSLNGFLTWQYGDQTRPEQLGQPDRDFPVSRLSPFRGSLALRYDSPSSIWWAEARATAAARANRLAPNDEGDTQRIPPGGTPSYLVFSANAGWQASENLDFTLGLQNLTDEDYRIHGSGLNEPGFGAFLTTRYSW